MDDFMTLVKRGVIYDGCPIVAKGTIRIKNGEASIESMHNLMAVDGKNFADLCQPGKSRTEQGQLTHTDTEELGEWKAKVEKMTQEKEMLSTGLQKTIASLQHRLEHEKRTSDHLSMQLKEAEALHAQHSATSSLSKSLSLEVQSLKLEVQSLQAKLEASEGLVKDLQCRLEAEGTLLAERGMRIHTLEQEKERSSKNLEQRAESLQEQLDNTSFILVEKEERLANLQQELGAVKEVAGKDKEAKVISEGLKDQVALLEAERMEDKRNSAIMLNDFSEWRSTAEDELGNLRKEVEHNKTTITTLKNELEIAELEESEFNAQITALRTENDELRKQLQLAARPPEPEKPSRKLRTQQSFKNLVKIMKPKEKDSSKEKEKEKKNSIASNPSV